MQGAPDATLTARMLANQVKLAADAVVRTYYDGWMRSDDELYPCDTRQVSLRAAPGGAPGTAPPDNKCSGKMGRTVNEQQLYTQLAFFRRLLGAAPFEDLHESFTGKVAASRRH